MSSFRAQKASARLPSASPPRHPVRYSPLAWSLQRLANQRVGGQGQLNFWVPKSWKSQASHGLEGSKSKTSPSIYFSYLLSDSASPVPLIRGKAQRIFSWSEWTRTCICRLALWHHLGIPDSRNKFLKQKSKIWRLDNRGPSYWVSQDTKADYLHPFFRTMLLFKKISEIMDLKGMFGYPLGVEGK